MNRQRWMAAALLLACAAATHAEEKEGVRKLPAREGLSYTVKTELFLQVDKNSGNAVAVKTEKTITNLEVKDGEATKVRVVYGTMQKSGKVAIGRREKELDPFPSVAGKAYVVELNPEKEKVKVLTEQGEKPPGEEREFVEDQFKRQFKMRKKLKEKERQGVDLAGEGTVKERVEEAVTQKLEEHGIEVEEFALEMQGPREENGVPCLAVGVVLKAGKGIFFVGDASVDLHGEVLVPLAIDAPASFHMEGPTSLVRKKGLLRLRKGDEYDGSMNFKVTMKLLDPGTPPEGAPAPGGRLREARAARGEKGEPAP